MLHTQWLVLFSDLTQCDQSWAGGSSSLSTTWEKHLQSNKNDVMVEMKIVVLAVWMSSDEFVVTNHISN